MYVSIVLALIKLDVHVSIRSTTCNSMDKGRHFLVLSRAGIDSHILASFLPSSLSHDIPSIVKFE